MLFIRIAVPSSLTEPVLAVLVDDDSVSSLAVHTGASVRPVGDIIEADLAREGSNDVITRLHALGIAEHGTMQIHPVPTWVSRSALQADQQTPGSSADAVVWAQVTQQSYDESEFNWTFGSFMVLATLLAAVAIVLDSQILVIGAMVLGPEFGAVAALGVAMVRRKPMLFTRASLTLLGGFALAILITALIAVIGRAVRWVTLADVTDPRPATGFIYHPDRWSFVVAIIAAAAGVLSLTSSRVGGLSGVFISVTTIPAAANVALGLAFQQRSEIIGSSVQLLLNLVGMALAGWLTLTVQHLVWRRVSARRADLVARRQRNAG